METKGYTQTDEEWCNEHNIKYDPDIPFNEPEHYISTILPLEAFDLWEETNWQSFQAEAAKDFTVAILSNPRWSEHFNATDKDFRFDKAYYKKVVIGNALSYTDELIKQLKERNIAKRITYLKNKKYEKELIEHNIEEIRLEKETALKRKAEQ